MTNKSTKYPAPTKAVIAAAGFGTRFLPQTKAMPKEMLPLIDKPIIQYVVEELIGAGIKDIIIIGSQNKRAIEDHFDTPNEDLLANLRAGGAKKAHLITEMNDLANMANFVYIRQKGAYGNATPIVSARPVINQGEPFIFTWADDFFRAETGQKTRFQQMIDLYRETGYSILSCKAVQDDIEFSRYGIVAGKKLNNQDHALDISKIIEKPGKDKAPSRLASVSSYLFTGDVLPHFMDWSDEFNRRTAEIQHNHSKESIGEFALQPLVQKMIDEGYHFLAQEITGAKYYDAGDKLEYLKTVIDFGLADPKFSDELKEFLRAKL